jgi:hypothetical protein
MVTASPKTKRSFSVTNRGAWTRTLCDLLEKQTSVRSYDLERVHDHPATGVGDYRIPAGDLRVPI